MLNANPDSVTAHLVAAIDLVLQFGVHGQDIVRQTDQPLVGALATVNTLRHSYEIENLKHTVFGLFSTARNRCASAL